MYDQAMGGFRGGFPQFAAPKGKGGKQIAAGGGGAMPAQKRQKGTAGQPVLQQGDAAEDGGTRTAEVRFETAESCSAALASMQGSFLGGSPISLVLDPRSLDQTRLIASNLPQGVEWQEVKDHFSAIGNLAFVDVRGSRRHGPKLTGEIRFDSADGAVAAIQFLQGTEMEGGGQIGIEVDPRSQDGTKLLISGLPPGTVWQDLKDHFGQVGHTVAYAGVNPAGGCVGEIRYDDPAHTQLALRTLNGSLLGGSQIFVQADPFSTDGSKLIVTGLSAGVAWQELKDHFATVGQVAFATTLQKGGKGKGKHSGMPFAPANGFGGRKGGQGQQPMMVMMMPQGGKGKGQQGQPQMMMLVPASQAGHYGGGANMMSMPYAFG